MTETITTDVLVIGGGAAAARAALEASRMGVKVTLVDKGRYGDSGTSPNCLFGICVPIHVGDSPEAFFQDWVKVGCGMSDQNLIWESATGAAANILQLLESGVDFAKVSGGRYYVYRGAGHSRARNLSIKYKDPRPNLLPVFGKRMKREGATLLEGIAITRLLTSEGAVTGAVGITSRRTFYVFEAKAVVLSCGGSNRTFPCLPAWIRNDRYRTTGDAFALGYSAGATLIDMEFSNFREAPPGASRAGGQYLNARGERFMERYDPALEKAPRQVTVAAMYNELKEGRGPLYWHFDRSIIEKEQSMLARFSKAKRVKLAIEFQRLLGGLRINEKAETDVSRLYAAGESAGGLHGGDRMQGNGFLDTQIFGARAGCHAARCALEAVRLPIDLSQVEDEKARIKNVNGDLSPSEVTKEIQKTMWDDAGIIRSAECLSKAMAVISALKRKVPRLSGKQIISALDCKNLLLTSEMIIQAALRREESRGSHRRTDFPNRNDAKWLNHIGIRNMDGEIALSTIPVESRHSSIP
jgi:succinate dehydrogenase/fumarate reductase flavoprotein subunit